MTNLEDRTLNLTLTTNGRRTNSCLLGVAVGGEDDRIVGGEGCLVDVGNVDGRIAPLAVLAALVSSDNVAGGSCGDCIGQSLACIDKVGELKSAVDAKGVVAPSIVDETVPSGVAGLASTARLAPRFGGLKK